MLSRIRCQAQGFGQVRDLHVRCSLQARHRARKVGQAAITNKSISSGRQYFSQLRFRTTGVGSLVFPTRTLSRHCTPTRGFPFATSVEDREEYVSQGRDHLHLPEGGRLHPHPQCLGPYTLADTSYMVPSEGVYVLDLVSTLALVRCIDSDRCPKTQYTKSPCHWAIAWYTEMCDSIASTR